MKEEIKCRVQELLPGAARVEVDVGGPFNPIGVMVEAESGKSHAVNIARNIPGNILRPRQIALIAAAALQEWFLLKEGVDLT